MARRRDDATLAVARQNRHRHQSDIRTHIQHHILLAQLAENPNVVIFEDTLLASSLDTLRPSREVNLCAEITELTRVSRPRVSRPILQFPNECHAERALAGLLIA
jgi:hypothetical protein